MVKAQSYRSMPKIGAVALGALAVGLLWQPVMLDPKPAWYAFGALKYVNYLLFLAPFGAVYLLNRGARGRGWVQGGLMLSIGYLLTLPYNAIMENAKFGSGEGFVKFHGGSWAVAIGVYIIPVTVTFFLVGALVGHFGGKTGRARRAPESKGFEAAGAAAERVTQEGVSGPGAQ